MFPVDFPSKPVMKQRLRRGQRSEHGRVAASNSLGSPMSVAWAALRHHGDVIVVVVVGLFVGSIVCINRYKLTKSQLTMSLLQLSALEGILSAVIARHPLMMYLWGGLMDHETFEIVPWSLVTSQWFLFVNCPYSLACLSNQTCFRHHKLIFNHHELVIITIIVLIAAITIIIPIID